VNLHIMS